MGRNAIFFIQVLISQTVLGECNRGDMDVRCHTLWHTTAILELENIFVSVLERLMIRRTLSPNGVVLVKLFFSAPCFWTIIDKILKNFIAMSYRLFRTTGRERRPPSQFGHIPPRLDGHKQPPRQQTGSQTQPEETSVFGRFQVYGKVSLLSRWLWFDPEITLPRN